MAWPGRGEIDWKEFGVNSKEELLEKLNKVSNVDWHVTQTVSMLNIYNLSELNLRNAYYLLQVCML